MGVSRSEEPVTALGAQSLVPNHAAGTRRVSGKIVAGVEAIDQERNEF